MSLDGKHYMIEDGTQEYANSFHFLNPKLRITSFKKFKNNKIVTSAALIIRTLRIENENDDENTRNSP